MINKIDDSVASKVGDDKLQDICLPNGDIKTFRNMFQETSNTMQL